VDGELARMLEPGLHVFWKFQRVLKALGSPWAHGGR